MAKKPMRTATGRGNDRIAQGLALGQVAKKQMQAGQKGNSYGSAKKSAKLLNEAVTIRKSAKKK